MNARVIEIQDAKSAETELIKIGTDLGGVKIMAPKALFRVIKLQGLRPPAANIIKQEMLSFGGEAATAYGAINHSIQKTDLLLFGTLRQIGELVKKLKFHQFGLPEVSAQIELCLKNQASNPSPLKIGSKTLAFGKRTYIMGILNVTPDSFSDGGKYVGVGEAVERAEMMLKEGADIIDVGGESTRPGSLLVSVAEEIKRVVPVIKVLSKRHGIVISIDTRKGLVAKAALEAGASMVNDVSGLRFDRKLAKVVASFNVPICIMHCKGKPQTMQKKPFYSDLMGEIFQSLEESIAIATNAGILQNKILLDPGIGFGKRLEHNLEILKRLRELRCLGRPIMVGPSRKSLIGNILGLPVKDRIEGTAAAVAIAIANGADIVRVHDVKEIKRVAQMTDAIVRQQKE